MNDTPSKPTKPVVAKPAVKKVVKKSIETPAPAKASKKTTKAVAPVTTESPTAAKHGKEGKASKVKTASVKPPKLIRDSFSFPETDYAMIGTLKARALKAGCEVKKSELLRAGLAALSGLSDDELLQGLAGIVKLKTGRPAK